MNPRVPDRAEDASDRDAEDALTDHEGRSSALPPAQDGPRLDEAAKQAAVLDAVPTHIALLDDHGVIVSVNEAWRLLADANDLHSPGHAVGVNYLAICGAARGTHSAVARRVAAGIRAVLAGESGSFSLEYPCHSATEQRWFLMTVTRLSEQRSDGVVVMHLDISERHRTEEAARRFRSALDASVDGIFIVDRGTMRYIEVNATACAMLGYTREELLAIGPVQATTAPLEQLKKVYDAIIAGRATTELAETVLRRKDGSTFPVEAHRHAQLSEDGWLIVGVLRDVTERQRATRALDRTVARLNEAQRIARTGSWETDLATLAVTWSAETHRIFETDPATFRVTHPAFLQFVHPDDRAEVTSAFDKSLVTHTVSAVHHRLLLPSGHVKYVEERWRIVLDEHEKPASAVGTCQDLTEHRWADELVQQAPDTGNPRQSRRVLAELAALAAGTALVFILASRFNWFELLTHSISADDEGQSDELWIAALFLLLGLVVFALRRLRESHAALAGYQRVQSALRLLRQDLDLRVNQRTVELASANQILNVEINDRKKTQAELREANSRFIELAEHIDKAFILTNSDNSKVLYVNPAYEKIWGRSCASLYADPSSWTEAIHPDDRARVLAGRQDAEHGAGFDSEYRILHADGSVHWIHALGFPVRDEAGHVYRIAATAEDITERKRIELRAAQLSRVYVVLSRINSLIVHVRNREELFDGACQIAIDAGGFRMSMIGIVDKHKVVIEASAGKDVALLAAVNDTLSSQDLGPRSMVMTALRTRKAVVSNDSRGDPRLLLGDLYTQAGVRSVAVLPLLVAGEAVGFFVLYASVPDFFHDEEMKSLGELADNVAFAIDHLRKTERLSYLAYYDALTGLANRSLFLERAAQAMRDRVAVGAMLQMVVLDLEHFKQVNDKFGRVAGDALLVWVAERLTRTLGDASLVARVGADQFALLIPQAEREGDVARFLEQTMLALQADAFSFEGHAMHVAAKYGVAQFPGDGVDAEALFKNAEVALKLAKSSGERFAYFSSEMNARNAQRLELEEQLRTAIDARQFVLDYQPKVDMISGELIGAEALIRWQHPNRGLLLPKEFIELAEETGLIVPIGTWVIGAVCAQQAAWIAAGIRVVPVAVNLGAAQFDKSDLLHTVRTALKTHSLDAGHIELELTESAVMNNSSTAAETLQALRKLGVGLALDDFGTGYSSLAHLKRFPFNSVKIDRSFITDIIRNPEDAAIASAIIAMAHSIGLKVVAEGVETQGQFNYLRAHGCDQMQGHFFCAAVPPEAFESDLRNQRRMQVTPVADGERNLLLVDDEANIRTALVRMLRSDGYNILSAASGAEGLELLALHPVQVIISDQRMPEMTGAEFLDTVKQMYPDTIRMILSGYTDLNVVTEAVNRGAVFKFLTKPWDDVSLREHVRDAFKRYRSPRTS